MSLQYILIGVCAVLALTGAVAAWTEREKPLPPPKDDDRDWSGAFMRDIKRWSR